MIDGLHLQEISTKINNLLFSISVICIFKIFYNAVKHAFKDLFITADVHLFIFLYNLTLTK